MTWCNYGGQATVCISKLKKNEKPGLMGLWGPCQLSHSMMPWTNELLQRPFSNTEHTKMTLVRSHNGNSCNLPTAGESSASDGLISCLASLRTKAPSGHRLQCETTPRKGSTQPARSGKLLPVSWLQGPAWGYASHGSSALSPWVVYGHLICLQDAYVLLSNWKITHWTAPGAHTQYRQAPGLIRERHVSAELAFPTQNCVLVTPVKEIE